MLHRNPEDTYRGTPKKQPRTILAGFLQFAGMFIPAESKSGVPPTRTRAWRLWHEMMAKPPEGSTPTADLAEKIQALRAANMVEAAPERTGARKALMAERPCDGGIRERMGEQPVAETKTEEPIAATIEEKPTPEEPPASPPAAVIAYQSR